MSIAIGVIMGRWADRAPLPQTGKSPERPRSLLSCGVEFASSWWRVPPAALWLSRPRPRRHAHQQSKCFHSAPGSAFPVESLCPPVPLVPLPAFAGGQHCQRRWGAQGALAPKDTGNATVPCGRPGAAHPLGPSAGRAQSPPPHWAHSGLTTIALLKLRQTARRSFSAPGSPEPRRGASHRETPCLSLFWRFLTVHRGVSNVVVGPATRHRPVAVSSPALVAYKPQLAGARVSRYLQEMRADGGDPSPNTARPSSPPT